VRPQQIVVQRRHDRAEGHAVTLVDRDPFDAPRGVEREHDFVELDHALVARRRTVRLLASPQAR
jgi:hypothetical protein